MTSNVTTTASKTYDLRFLTPVYKKNGFYFLLFFGVVESNDRKAFYFRFLIKNGDNDSMGNMVIIDVCQARALLQILSKTLENAESQSEICGNFMFATADNDSKVELQIVKNDGTNDFVFQLGRDEASKLQCLLQMLTKVTEGGVTPEQVHIATVKKLIGHLGNDIQKAYVDNIYDISVWSYLSYRLFDFGSTSTHGENINERLVNTFIPDTAKMAVELTFLNEITD